MSPVNGYSAEAPAVISIVDQFEGTSGPGPASTLLPATTVPGGTSSVSSPVTNPSATSPPASIAPAAAPSGAVPNFGLAVVSVNVQSGWATFESDSSGNRQDVRYEACPRYFTSTQNGDAGLTALHPGDFVGLEIDAMTPAHCMVNATVWAAPKWPACQATGPARWSGPSGSRPTRPSSRSFTHRSDSPSPLWSITGAGRRWCQHSSAARRGWRASDRGPRS